MPVEFDTLAPLKRLNGIAQYIRDSLPEASKCANYFLAHDDTIAEQMLASKNLDSSVEIDFIPQLHIDVNIDVPRTPNLSQAS